MLDLGYQKLLESAYNWELKGYVEIPSDPVSLFDIYYYPYALQRLRPRK